MTIPGATYRLQFRESFGFRQAAAIAPYLRRLGVSHVYASPYFKARPGSSHGYDIVDHHALNPELGSEEDYVAMVAALQREGLGQILDFVPNHMGVGGADNPLWLDVLEWGSSSDYAAWFDIDWQSDGSFLKNKLLAPVLADQYGLELKNGKLALKYDANEGALAIWAYDKHKLPICPLHYARILGHSDANLDRLGDLFSDLPSWRPQIAARALALKREVSALLSENLSARQTVAQRIVEINADWRALDNLIAAQHWRPAFYGVAGDEINYRRFFNINELAGLRMELPAVFQHAHARVVAMIEAKAIDGVRLDHVDGLFDPASYFRNLRAASRRPFYLVVEKILAAHEQLREDWEVDGTTGYDFANLVLGILINPGAEENFEESYRSFTALTQPFSEIVRDCKLHIMENEMASELNALSRDAARLARQNPVTVDFTRQILQRAIKQIVASFPVYRTYVDMSGAATEPDSRDLEWAIARAQRGDPLIDPSVYKFLHGALAGNLASALDSGFSRTSVLRLAMKLQQYSGPVMAKGLEDTAFYRYNRFIALNEVGGDPTRFGVSVSAFHKANLQRAKRWPHAMLATSTHDTKLGEDARARLAALSDVPGDWRRQVVTWSRLLRARRGDVEGRAPPDRNDEYRFYQLLVATWPVALLDEPQSAPLEAYRERICAALVKGMREAKLHSRWASPDTIYEEAMLSFARDALDAARPGFLASFLPFVQKIARLGVQNSLIQTIMKLTLPGVPDIYQGCETWDLTLVDPDNRRPVDYSSRAQALGDLSLRLSRIEDRGAAFDDLLRNWRDGAVKLATTTLLLQLRRAHERLFAEGDYQPLPIHGATQDLALAYCRSFKRERLAIVIARFPGLRQADPKWGDAAVELPEGRWIDVLSGRQFGGVEPLASRLASFPAAVLMSQEPVSL
jgi:(1->4)-alpha-D-glucan 1-alpha-D-glucosylmutase